MYAIWNNLKTTVLMAGLMGLCMAVAYALGGPHAMVYGLVIGGFLNLIAFFFSDRIALMTVRAVPIQRSEDPLLWDTVEQLARKAGLPMPGVYVSPAAAPNAFATGRSPRHSAVCVTEGLRQMLTDRQLEGVIAHELAHIRHRDILISTVAAIVAGAITWLAHMALFMGVSGGGSTDRNRRSNPLVMLLIMVLAPLAATLIQLAISRSREFEADRAGARLVGSGRPLAQALARLDAASRRYILPVPDSQANMFIVAPLTGSEVAKLFMTHPPVQERIARLNAIG